MTSQPVLETNRMILRAFSQSDAADVKAKAGDSRVAKMTEAVPHPYEDGMAEEWISTHAAHWDNGSRATWAVSLKRTEELLGCIGLVINAKHHRASLGYWIAPEYWGRGYCTEAALAVLNVGFSGLDLQRIEAIHLVKNPASGAVMRKIGMKHEGTMLQYVLKDGVFEDMERYAIVRL